MTEVLLVVFSAATCVLAASQSSMINKTLPEDILNTFWERCLSILHAHEAHIFTARRAIKVLGAKKQRILASQSTITGKSQLCDWVQQYVLITDLALNQDVPLSSINNSSLGERENNSANHLTDIEFPDTFGMLDGFDINNIDVTWLDQCLANLDWLDPAAG